MAQQAEPLYDFPEPTQSSVRKLLGLQRGRGSLRSISVLDRLLLTVPVWLQMSINAATALHILQREPPGTFLVRKSRTSQTNVLCVRLADDSVPSFVEQFGIREEQCTLSLETSAISFPDLPRLISFYCVSRDVLPFPLELPEAIARATSHKELESISHMGIEFWSSHLNVRGPREVLKLQENKEKKPDSVTSASPAAPPPTTSESTAQPDPDNQVRTVPESDTTTKPSGPKPTLFHEFCPITTRSPRELDCGSGLGALCFINPLFLQTQNILSAQRLFKRSLKVRISTETSTMLSPPLAPPPPPPLMPKTKGRCKARKQGIGHNQLSEGSSLLQSGSQSTAQEPLAQTQDTPMEAPMQPPSAAPDLQSEPQEQGHNQAHTEETAASAQLPVVEHLPDDSDYMQPPMIIFPQPPSLSPYLSPAAQPPFPKVSPPLSTHSSPCASPSLSPYQFPSTSTKVPRFLSPHDSPSASPSLSPYQSPAPSPKLPFSLSPFTLIPFSQLTEQAYHTPPPPTRADQPRSERDADEEECAAAGEKRDGDGGTVEELHEKDEECMDLQMNAVSLNDTDSCSSFSSLEGAAETPPVLPQCKDSSL